MKIAVLGMGAMGLPMAECLNDHFDVVGFDPDPARMELGAKDGLRTRDTAQEAAQGRDVVLAAIRDAGQLDALLWGDGGIADVMKDGSVLLLTSTVGIDVVHETAAKLAPKNIGMVDAPISGGPARARAGDFLVVVGTTEQSWNKVKPALDALASTLVWVDKRPGGGQAMKTVNQLLCGVHIAAAGEAFALAGKLGLDQEMALEALMAGAAQSFMLGDRGPCVIEAYKGGKPEVKSKVDIFVKDMGIVTAAAQAVGLAVPLAATAEQEYLMGHAAGYGDCDDSSVVKVVAPDAR